MKSFFILLFLFPLLSFAQKEDRVWVFDDSVAIDWNDTLNPVVYQIGTNQSMDENYASICDKNGNLLFYSGGINNNYTSHWFTAIYGADQLKIPNGDSINTNRSITQGILILPVVNDTNKYYFFYLATDNWYTEDSAFSYAIIDKSIGAYGSCIIKNVMLEKSYFNEKLTAVRHGNGQDWWIIIHKYNSNEFHKFLLTSSGISGPFIQSIGPNLNWIQGQMKFSPDGSKLGLVNGYYPKVAIFDFNRCTGMLSNYKNLGNEKAYGCSFSPNGKIFYTSTEDKLFQYSLDSSNIALTKFLLWDDSTSDYYIGQHLLAPDGKIYITTSIFLPNPLHDYHNMNLTVIQNPNVYGVGCNVQPYSFYLNGLRCLLGLPNLVNYNLGALIGSPCDTILNCASTQNNFSESICSGNMFDFNGTALTISGTYYDTLMNVGGCDSLITLQLSVLNTTSGNTSASICNGDSYSFNGNQITTAGNYFDTLVNVQGCDSLMTLQLSVLNNSTFSSSQKICAGDTLHIGNNAHYTAGIFIDTLLNATGCDSIVTILLTVDSVIVSVSSVGDTLTATASGVGITYQWINCDSSMNISGATNENFVAPATGNYAVIVTDGNNCSKQSACVFVLVSGVEQLTMDNGQLIIYPNPSDGEITIVLRPSFDKLRMTTITITDALGRIIISDKTNLNSKIINLKSFVAGVYFIKVQMSYGSFEVKKFVKE